MALDLAPFVALADPAMAIVTASDGSDRGGCLVGFHGQTSIEPPRYGVWLSKANHTYRVALHATHLGVHLVGSDQRDLAVLFGTTTGDDVDKLAQCGAVRDVAGAPVVEACRNWLVGRKVTLLDDGGDHVLVVLDPVASSVDGGGVIRLTAVDGLEPGHAAEERRHPPTERAVDS